MTKFQLRGVIALLALVVALTFSACWKSPTRPDPVVAQPGEPAPSVRPVGQIRNFDLQPYDPEHPTWGGVAGDFTRTSDPLKVLLFMNTEATYHLLTIIYVYDGGTYTAELAKAEITFTGKEGRVELSYDSSRCVYKSLATGDIQCVLSLRNLDPANKVFGTARMEGIPIR